MLYSYNLRSALCSVIIESYYLESILLKQWKPLNNIFYYNYIIIVPNLIYFYHLNMIFIFLDRILPKYSRRYLLLLRT